MQHIEVHRITTRVTDRPRQQGQVQDRGLVRSTGIRAPVPCMIPGLMVMVAGQRPQGIALIWVLRREPFPQAPGRPGMP